MPWMHMGVEWYITMSNHWQVDLQVIPQVSLQIHQSDSARSTRNYHQLLGYNRRNVLKNIVITIHDISNMLEKQAEQKSWNVES